MSLEGEFHHAMIGVADFTHQSPAEGFSTYCGIPDPAIHILNKALKRLVGVKRLVGIWYGMLGVYHLRRL